MKMSLTRRLLKKICGVDVKCFSILQNMNDFVVGYSTSLSNETSIYNSPVNWFTCIYNQNTCIPSVDFIFVFIFRAAS